MISANMSKRDEARFRKAIQKLVALSGEPVEDILRAQGRLFAVDAAKFTAPFGDKKADGDDTKRKVEKTIFSTYKKADDLRVDINRRLEAGRLLGLQNTLGAVTFRKLNS